MLHRLSLLLLLLCSTIVAPDTLTIYDMKALDMWKFPAVNVDGYLKFYYNNHYIGTTEVKKNTRDPVWEESFSYKRAKDGKVLKIKVYDNDVRFNKLLGICMTKIEKGHHQRNCELITGGMLMFTYSLH